MKKQILNIGTALNKAEQKQINGGYHEQDTDGCIQSSFRSCVVQAPTISNGCNPSEICATGIIFTYGSDGQYTGYGPGTCQCPS